MHCVSSAILAAMPSGGLRCLADWLNRIWQKAFGCQRPRHPLKIWVWVLPKPIMSMHKLACHACMSKADPRWLSQVEKYV